MRKLHVVTNVLLTGWQFRLCSRRFTTQDFSTPVYKTALGKRKSLAEAGDDYPRLHGPAVSAACFEMMHEEFAKKCEDWCEECNPELTIFKDTDRSVLLDATYSCCHRCSPAKTFHVTNVWSHQQAVSCYGSNVAFVFCKVCLLYYCHACFAQLLDHDHHGGSRLDGLI